MHKERVSLQSCEYPPFGSDLRKVSFDWQWGRWWCLRMWVYNQPLFFWRLDSSWYPFQASEDQLFDLQYAYATNGSESGYERLWCPQPGIEDEKVHLTFQINEGTLDHLIEHANLQYAPPIDTVIRRVDKWWEYLPILKGKYEGHVRLLNFTDESG